MGVGVGVGSGKEPSIFSKREERSLKPSIRKHNRFAQRGHIAGESKFFSRTTLVMPIEAAEMNVLKSKALYVLVTNWRSSEQVSNVARI